MKKIRLTERNLQNLIGKVVNETKKMKNTKIRLTEKKVEVWCECGDNEGCYGSWGGGSSMIEWLLLMDLWVTTLN